jgi:hypothetical protein
LLDQPVVRLAGVWLVLACLAGPLAACDDNDSTAEKVGEAVEEAGDEAGDAIEDAGDAAEDAVQ